ncbi:hypothetical protein M408DRAFT_263257 [Serendipita vermifera MAFF 305830]|uniref:Uncharacterized protein n=1 Tax=Serendipita vermifera MAFF 305830 TaxID=933852 RepID=A0A0C3AVV1_SERVB|nr:hypothetical protein M408DRAFT_263257 [Serendipita vermifera MAFF 305830]
MHFTSYLIVLATTTSTLALPVVRYPGDGSATSLTKKHGQASSHHPTGFDLMSHKSEESDEAAISNFHHHHRLQARAVKKSGTTPAGKAVLAQKKKSIK